MSMLVFVPIVLGMGLLIGGSLTDNETAYNIGGLVLTAGIPVTMFALVVVGLVLMMTGKLDLSDGKKSANCGKSKAEVKKNDDEWESVDDDESEWVEVEDDGDEVKDVGGGEDSISCGQKKKEYSRRSDTTTSRSYNDKIKQAEYISRQSGNRYKNSTTTQKVFGWLFFGFLMTDFFMIMVFAFIGIFVGAIVCFCLFGGTILIALLVTVLRQKISMGLGVSKKKKRDALDGKVLSCDVASTTTVNNRVTKVVYLVEISDGENEYSAYTEDYYDRGDDIKFCKIGKKLAMILDKEEFDDDEPLDL